MSNDALKDRGQAHENAYIKRREAELLARLRQAQDSGLSAATGLDAANVARLEKWKVGMEQLTALHLVPLIEVAWADGTIGKRERRLIESALQSRGLSAGSVGWTFIQRIVEVRPTDAFFDDMRAVLAGLIAHQSQEEAAATTIEVTSWARRAAEAGGGFLGFGPKVDETEGRVLRELTEQLAAAFPEKK